MTAEKAYRAADRAEEEPDDLDEYLEEQLVDPGFRQAFEDAEARTQLLNALIDARHRRSASQVAVAERMGTTQSAISELEGGASDARLSTLQRYARAVDCELKFWLEGCSENAGGFGTWIHATEVLNRYMERRETESSAKIFPFKACRAAQNAYQVSDASHSEQSSAPKALAS